MVKLRQGYEAAPVDEFISGMRALAVPGMRTLTAGPDAGLREGNWDLAVVADFEDAAAYRVYDADAEHNRLRAVLKNQVDSLARCQFEL